MSWTLHWDLSCIEMWVCSTCLRVNKIIIQKATYFSKSRLMDCKEVSVLRASLRYLRPWPVNLKQLFTGQQNHSSKNHLPCKIEIDGVQRTGLFQILPKGAEAFTWDIIAPTWSEENCLYRNHLPFKGQINGLQRNECLKTLTEVFMALVCDIIASTRKLANLFDKNCLPLKIEIDRF